MCNKIQFIFQTRDNRIVMYALLYIFMRIEKIETFCSSLSVSIDATAMQNGNFNIFRTNEQPKKKQKNKHIQCVIA